MATAARFVGSSVRRREDPRLLTGHGTYVDDITVPGMLHAAFLRSPFARARIRSIDAEAARQLDGVHAVFTAADLNPTASRTYFGMMGPDAPSAPWHPLADGDVRFVGDPVAMVVADSRYLAEDGCDLIDVDYEPQEPIVDFETAAAEADRIVHPELGTNVAAGGPPPEDPGFEEIFTNAPHVFTETLRQHRQTNVPMETRGLIAHWDPFAGELRVWISTQGPHEVRAYLGRVLGIPEHHIRVTMHDVGGGFGQKMFMMRDELCVVLASRLLGRPVKWIEDRHENLVASNHARTERATVRMATDDAGHILAAGVDHLDDVGAYPAGSSAGSGMLISMMFTGPYKIPRMGFSGATVHTNTCGKAAYRGPWMMETVAREMMVDIVARELRIDPLELRRRNVVQQEDLPYQTAMFMEYNRMSPAESLDQAAELIGYDEFRRQQAEARAEGRYLGIGLAAYIEPSGIGFGILGTEAATIRVEPGGKVTVLMSTASHGHSTETTMVQVVADELGVDIDDVVLLQGDTAVSPYGPGTGGSRTAIIAGGAAYGAAQSLRDKVLTIAAHSLEAAAEDLEISNSVISVRGTPTRSVTLPEIAALAYAGHDQLPPGTEPGLEATNRYKAPFVTFSNSTHACTCEVDVATGKVSLLRYVVSEDCGVMINPMVVEGQIAGGVVQGIGGVLYENMIYDEDGNPRTTTFLDYLLPTAAEVPTIEYGHIETPSDTPGGHKGMGEGGAIGSPPAIINAVADALAPLGVKITSQPLGPAQIVDLIESASISSSTG